MRVKLLLIELAIILSTCTSGKKIESNANQGTVAKTDTLYIENVFKVDSLTSLTVSQAEEIQVLKDSIFTLNNSITQEDFLNRLRIERIKYYISITEKRPANQKFFYGWVRRTMSY